VNPKKKSDSKSKSTEAKKFSAKVASTQPGFPIEISGDKQAEEALQISESSLLAVLQSTPDGILAIGSENDVLFANERFVKLWRIPQAVMASKDASVLLRYILDQLSDPQSFLKKVQELYKSKEESFDTLNFKDGRVFEWQSRPFMQEAGVHGRVWSVRDITARKQAEETLTSSEAELRALFASMHDVVVVIDRAGVYRMITPTNPELLVKPSEELLGKTLQDVFPSEQAETFITVVQQVLDTKQTAQIEYDLIIGERTVQFETSISPMTADHTLWVARDISERKRAEVVLAEERTLLRTLIDIMPDHIYAKDAEGRFTLGNIALARHMGATTPDELIGKSDFDFYPPDLAAQFHADEQALIQSGQSLLNHEEPTRDLAGRPKWTSTTKVLFSDSQGKNIGLVGIGRDITDQKWAEAELQASRESERNFSRRLTILSETTTELSKADSLDTLCRCAVELGRERLDFDRLSIFFLSEDSNSILGTFGVDEEGQITDERGDRHPVGPESNIRSILQSQVPLLRLTDAPLALKGQDIGQGTHVFAGLWDGTTAIGYISVDNLLRQRPISDRDCEIIRLYASALGHLCSLKRTQDELRTSEERFTKSFQSNPIATIIDNLPEGRLLDVNETFLRLTGYNREEIIGKTSLELNLWVNPEDCIRFEQGLIEQQSLRDVESQLLKKSGENLHVLASAEIIEIAGRPHGLIMLSDISERKRNELVQDAIFRITQAAITSKGIDELYHSIHSILGELIPAENFFIALYDPLNQLISFPYFVDQYNQPPSAPTKLQGLTGHVIRTGSSLLVTRALFDRLVGQGVVEVVGTAFVEWMGAPLKVEGRMIGVMAVQSYTNGILFTQEDLSLLEFVSTQVAQAIERKRMEEEIRNLSLTDELTGLYNRRGFTLLADHEIKLAHRIKKNMLLFFGDVDNLKTINDTHGHAQGDLALKDVSAILKETFREADIAARYGGDEFVVLAVGASMESADFITNRIQSILEKRNQQGDRPFQLNLSLGIAHYDPEAPCTIGELIAQADGRMYQQKQARKGKQ
jgi:diguanylate cyclase (GGDEF)-like protein/PAS domain S-box-containing protein